MMESTLLTDLWIRYRQSRQHAQLRLFCFPYAGGSASIFRNWSEHLPPGIEVWPVQLPGRENRSMEEPFSHMSALIECLGPALLPCFDKPYAFFGHSMGATICFELARYVRQKGHSLAPVHLYVSGHRAPQIPDPNPPTYHLPEPEFIADLRRLKGTPEEVLQNAELLQFLLPLLRADFALSQAYLYTPEQPLSCSISAFCGLRDTESSREEIEGWRKQTSTSFNLHLLNGDHFFLHKEQNTLMQILSQELMKDLLELG